MFIIWYILLAFINLIFLILHIIFVQLLRLDSSFLSFLKSTVNKNSLVSDKSNQNPKNSNVFFEDLYSEYKFLSKNNDVSLKQNILNNTSYLNLFGNYDYFLNFYLNTNNVSLNSSKLNLNYLNNTLNVANLNKTFSNYKTNYSFSKISSVVSQNLPSINISEILEKKVSGNWSIKYSPSNFIKYINSTNLAKYTILYLRKNKVFNKGRYSRNRQYYRTGVYWCLYINIIAVVGIHFWFYKLTMNFGYLWWLLFIFILSFIAPKSMKYKLYNPLNLYNNYISNFVWLSLILSNILSYFLNIVNSLKKYLLNININIFSNVNSSVFLNFYLIIISILGNSKYLNNNILYSYEFNYFNYYYSKK